MLLDRYYVMYMMAYAVLHNNVAKRTYNLRFAQHVPTSECCSRYARTPPMYYACSNPGEKNVKIFFFFKHPSYLIFLRICLHLSCPTTNPTMFLPHVLCSPGKTRLLQARMNASKMCKWWNWVAVLVHKGNDKVSDGWWSYCYLLSCYLALAILGVFLLIPLQQLYICTWKESTCGRSSIEYNGDSGLYIFRGIHAAIITVEPSTDFSLSFP